MTPTPFGSNCASAGLSRSSGGAGWRRVAHGSGLGRYRWVVERTLAWLHQFRRLRIRYERRDDIHEAFLILGCAIICWRHVQRSLC
jgi:transposase